MVGFNPDASVFFFYVFVCWIVALLFTSIGQAVSAALSTADVAQAVVGLVSTLFFCQAVGGGCGVGLLPGFICVSHCNR